MLDALKKKKMDRLKKKEKNCIDATIRISRGIQCLPYAGFLYFTHYATCFWLSLFCPCFVPACPFAVPVLSLALNGIISK